MSALVGRIEAPLVNTNEPQSHVVELTIAAYSPISEGDPVCVLETSKGTVELESEFSGHTGAVTIAEGDWIDAGTIICEVFDTPVAPGDDQQADAGPDLGDLRLTRKARELVAASDLADSALAELGRLGGFITEEHVRDLIARTATPTDLPEEVLQGITGNSMVLFGGGGHAKSLIDLVRTSTDFVVCAVADDRPGGEHLMGVPIAGNAATLALLRAAGVEYAINGVGGLGRIDSRIRVTERLEAAGLTIPALVAAGASVAPSATLADGVQVFAGAVVWSDVTIEAGAIINTGAVVSHDCRIGRHAHVTPGALLAGGVEVGEAALIGMGVTTTPGIRIGTRAVVGNRAEVHGDVPDGTVVAAGSTWPPAEA